LSGSVHKEEEVQCSASKLETEEELFPKWGKRWFREDALRPEQPNFRVLLLEEFSCLSVEEA